jgi:sulfatase modifying factor 1
MKPTSRDLIKAVMLVALASASVSAQADGLSSTARIPAGQLETVLPPAPGLKTAKVASFQLDRMPVTNAQFAKFVRSNPEWQRDRVAAVFADGRYLRHWAAATAPASDIAHQPVTHVSWFAASAHCESQGKRLPTWYEWEYVAAASERARDARNDPQWRQQILSWYSKSARHGLPDVGKTTPNIYGVYDMHGVVWEWVSDLSAMLVSSDNRQQSDPDVVKFCGSGALSMEEKENYSTLMRIAMLSSMKASYTSQTMGFRCASGG